MNDSDHGLNLEFNLPAEHLVATPHVDEDQLNGAIRSILHGADLEQLSRRMIRKQLEAQFHMDLSHFKDKINECILRIIEEQQQAEEGDDDEPEPSDADDDNDDDDDDEEEERRPSPSKAKKTKAKSAPAKKKPAAPKRKRGDDAGSSGNGGSSAFNMKLSLSPELASVVGADTMARPQIVKALWEYIREHDLQDPNNKRVIIFDEKLREVFQRDSVTMFSVNKFVKRHVRKPEELPPGGWADIPRDGVSSDEDEADKATKKKAAAAKKKKKAASNADDEDGEKKQRKNPFNAELAISPELAVVVGSDRLARPQIVKQIWEYIRAHNLQDPNDKRTILLDETMRRAFQRDTVTMFSINKYIKRHAMKPENLPPGGWADVPRDGASSDEDEDSGKSKKKKAKK